MASQFYKNEKFSFKFVYFLDNLGTSFKKSIRDSLCKIFFSKNPKKGKKTFKKSVWIYCEKKKKKLKNSKKLFIFFYWRQALARRGERFYILNESTPFQHFVMCRTGLPYRLKLLPWLLSEQCCWSMVTSQWSGQKVTYNLIFNM